MDENQKRVIRAEDLYQFQWISTARIAPNGESIAYAQHRVDPKTEKKYANLWITSLSGGPRQFTQGDQVDARPVWSPDGSQIAFLSNRKNQEKPAQIFLISSQGGEAQQLGDIPGAILHLAWSPDGKSLLLLVRKTDAEVLEREKDEQKKKLGVVCRQVDRLFYKLDGYGYLPKERVHIWTVDVKTGVATQITDHPVFDEGTPCWSPDGQWITFTSVRTPDPDSTPDHFGVYVIPARGGEINEIEAQAGFKQNATYSPDGRWIAYYGLDGENVDYKNLSLWVVPADGSGSARNLTGPYDVHVQAGTSYDIASPEFMPPTWSKDSQSIYFQITLHGDNRLMKINVDGSAYEPVIAEPGVLGSFSFDREQKTLGYVWSTLTDPCQVYRKDMPGDKVECLSKVNRELLAGIDLGQVEEVWYKGADGTDLQGWIVKPPHFDPARKYPSILEIHGGPRLQYGRMFMHEFYYLASQGYVVYFTNPRGGRGYGEEHTKAIWGGWGGADYADLMAWADTVEKLPYIDPQRMGVTGGSYGGYMTVWIIGHTGRFKAAVTQRCVSNFVSMWGSSDFNWSFQYELNNKAPFEDLQKHWDHSPIKYIGNARTPTMVIHNENDLRCPIEQGEQVFVALKRLGVDTEMIRFPDEFHGLSREGRTDRRIARLGHIARWFNKYLSE
ncbi:MAG TPA: S9 family peptidase [Anaerolineaceae bacterium]|nr:S9 family peptidase [Anaerolineaceae bacterium]